MAMRRTLRAPTLTAFAVIAAFCTVSPTAQAQSKATARQKVPTAGKIIERHVKAVGGKKALRAIRGVRYVGEVAGATGTATSFVWQMKAPHFLYLEVHSDSAPVTEAYNGKSAWQQDAAGLRTLVGREQSRARATALFRNDRLLHYKKDKTKAQTLGRAMFEGREAFAVQLTTASGLQRKLYFDAQSGLLAGEEQERDGGIEQIAYGDYRAVGGVLEPHRISLRRAAQSYDVTIRSVTHNPALDAAVFDYPRTAGEALPDAGQLLLDVENNQKVIEALQEKYTYNVADTEFEVDGKGNVRQKNQHEYEVFYLGSDSYWKLVGKNGKPLNESDARKEQEKVEKHIREYEERKEKEEREKAAGRRKKNDDDDDFSVLTFLQIAQFTHPRREIYRGQPVIVFDFEPRPGYKPRNRAESLVHKLGGTLWIDEHARQVARLEARMLDSFRIGGGLVASVGRGSAVVFEQELVHNEVWLPSYAEMNISARVLLVAAMKVNRTQRFSKYQRFSVDAKSEIKPPAPPPEF
jgi:hypothetical protein